MYHAEEFLINCPLLKGSVVKRLKEANALEPFNSDKVEEISRGLSSSERACVNFALTLYNIDLYPFEIGDMLRNVSDQPTLDHVAEWIRKGCFALD